MNREELRRENIARAEYLDAGGDPLRAVDMWPQLYPGKHPDTHSHPPAADQITSNRDLDLLADLLERVRKLEHTVAAQDEVIRGLVLWRMSARTPPGAPGPTPGPVQGETRPQGQSW